MLLWRKKKIFKIPYNLSWDHLQIAWQWQIKMYEMLLVSIIMHFITSNYLFFYFD